MPSSVPSYPNPPLPQLSSAETLLPPHHRIPRQFLLLPRHIPRQQHRCVNGVPRGVVAKWHFVLRVVRGRELGFFLMKGPRCLLRLSGVWIGRSRDGQGGGGSR